MPSTGVLERGEEESAAVVERTSKGELRIGESTDSFGVDRASGSPIGLLAGVLGGPLGLLLGWGRRRHDGRGVRRRSGRDLRGGAGGSRQGDSAGVHRGDRERGGAGGRGDRRGDEQARGRRARTGAFRARFSRPERGGGSGPRSAPSGSAKAGCSASPDRGRRARQVGCRGRLQSAPARRWPRRLVGIGRLILSSDNFIPRPWAHAVGRRGRSRRQRQPTKVGGSSPFIRFEARVRARGFFAGGRACGPAQCGSDERGC